MRITRALLKCTVPGLLLVVTLLSFPRGLSADVQVGEASDSRGPWRFEPTEAFSLLVDGQEDEAANLYLGHAQGSLLVISQNLSGPLLLRFREQEVDALEEALPEEQPDGSLLVSPGVARALLGPIERTADGLPIFRVEEHRVQISHGREVVGLFTLEELKKAIPTYAKKAKGYTPDAEVLARLRQIRAPVRIQVYFGSWCPLCSRYLPRLVNVHESLQTSRVQVEYRGLPQGRDPLLDEKDIPMIPAALVYSGDGTELGRILGEDWEHPEQALWNVMSSNEHPGR